jgi:hypothetical protein
MVWDSFRESSVTRLGRAATFSLHFSEFVTVNASNRVRIGFYHNWLRSQEKSLDFTKHLQLADVTRTSAIARLLALKRVAARRGMRRRGVMYAVRRSAHPVTWSRNRFISTASHTRLGAESIVVRFTEDDAAGDTASWTASGER